MTPVQSRLFKFIEMEALAGRTPSYREMAAHLGVKSTSGIHSLIQILEERRLLRRMPNRSRSIEIVGNGPTRPRLTQVLAEEVADLIIAEGRRRKRSQETFSTAEYRAMIIEILNTKGWA